MYVELDGTEIELSFKYQYYYQSAFTTGRPEDCYPEEEDFEYEVFEPDYWLNAIEQWELDNIGQDKFYDLAIEDMNK